MKQSTHPSNQHNLSPTATVDIVSLLTLGETCFNNKHYQNALLHFLKATLLAPQHIQALLGSAKSLLAMNRPAESTVYSEHALALRSNQQILNLHGQALYQMGHYADALACFVADPNDPATLSQRALCLTQLNRFDEAMQTYQQALALSPHNHVIRSNYAFCLLSLGKLRDGFQAFESRWQSQLSHRNHAWKLPIITKNDCLKGQSILINTEQGLGDSLQFFRYIPLLAERGARIILEVQPALIPLLSSWSNIVTLIAAGSPLPICDYHFSMMSLAFIFQTELHTIPAPIPYVFSESQRTASYRQMLKQSTRKRIGIAWRGSTLNALNHKRSIALQTLMTIRHPDVDFICLQHDVTHNEKAILDQHVIPYYGLELSSFEGTAALISCLDLVVTIDTSIAHLAGAMGKPVWILLHLSPDWRWLLEREDSPWYPTARLFRQTTMDNWQHPLERIKAAFNTLGKNSEITYSKVDHAALHQQALIALQHNNQASAIQLIQQAAQAAPSIPLYRRNLGELLRRVGRLNEAIESHTIAVDLEPNSAENHFHLALALNDNHQYETAVTHYRIALSHNINYGLAWNNLGASLECLDDKLGAQKAYAQAIQLNPAHAEAQNNLGAIYSEQGHLDEARQHFTAAIAVKPDFVEAHYNLSSLKTYTPDDPHLQMLESLNQKADNLTEYARIQYRFALGKALDDTQQYARAFQAYADGNRLKYAQEPWNEIRLRNLTHHITTVFNHAFLKKRCKTKSTGRPIFIVGMPRSGTTLIEQTLSSHASIHGAGELTFLDEIIHSARGAVRNTDFTTWAAQLTNKECIELGNIYLDRTRQLAPDKTYIIDKMPGNCFYIGMIYRMLPEAKIIHAMRDPMDSCFSCFTKLFNHSMPYAYDQEALGQYFMHYATIMQHWHQVLPKGVIFDLPYEIMVADHENQTRKLLDYIGLPWDPNCLNFYNNARLVKTASMAQVRKPIYQTSVKRWEHFTDELQTLARIVSPYRETYLMEHAL